MTEFKPGDLIKFVNEDGEQIEGAFASAIIPTPDNGLEALQWIEFPGNELGIYVKKLGTYRHEIIIPSLGMSLCFGDNELSLA